MQSGARVLQVNVSAGGVPKLPVERAWVGPLGLEGDAHNDRTEHGGPHRAVCLYGIEAIERLQAEGHPVEPGSVGENLTTLGVEWSELPVGARARIGPRLLLELASPSLPCSTQKPNFIGGRFSRISIELHPSDSRMYARVLEEGPVEPGDPIEILPPAPDSRAVDELLLARLDRAEAKSSLASWRAAQAAGFDAHVVEDGELAMVATPQVPGPAFNHATGLARLPHLVGLVTDFFDEHGATGWLMAQEPPWPGAEPTLELSIYGADPAAVPDAPLPEGVSVRGIERADAETVERIYEHAEAKRAATGDSAREIWIAVAREQAGMPHRYGLLAERDGRPVAVATLHVHRATGWLRGAAVVRAAQGHGLQRALIGKRVEIALEHGCDLVGASAEPGGPSAHNLERMGFRLLGTRRQYRYDARGPS